MLKEKFKLTPALPISIGAGGACNDYKRCSHRCKVCGNRSRGISWKIHYRQNKKQERGVII